MEETLKEILIELKTINKKLDAVTPCLTMNKVVDRFIERVQNELLNEKEIDNLKEIAEKKSIVAFSNHILSEQQQKLNRLLSIRREQKKSVLEVCRDLGITETSLRKYEACYRNPNDQLKIKLAEYYGVSVQELFFPDYEKK